MIIIKFQELPEVKEENLEKQFQNAIDAMYKEFTNEKEKEGLDSKTVDSKNDDSDEKESQSMAESGDSPK
jgi:hypothetical protein